MARHLALPFFVFTLLLAGCNDDEDDGSNGGNGDSSACTDASSAAECLACCEDLPNFAGHAFGNGMCMCGTLDESFGNPDGGVDEL